MKICLISQAWWIRSVSYCTHLTQVPRFVGRVFTKYVQIHCPRPPPAVFTVSFLPSQQMRRISQQVEIYLYIKRSSQELAGPAKGTLLLITESGWTISLKQRRTNLHFARDWRMIPCNSRVRRISFRAEYLCKFEFIFTKLPTFRGQVGGGGAFEGKN